MILQSYKKESIKIIDGSEVGIVVEQNTQTRIAQSHEL